MKDNKDSKAPTYPQSTKHSTGQQTNLKPLLKKTSLVEPNEGFVKRKKVGKRLSFCDEKNGQSLVQCFVIEPRPERQSKFNESSSKICCIS